MVVDIVFKAKTNYIKLQKINIIFFILITMNQPPASRYIRLYETHADASIGVISLYFNCMNVNFSFVAFVDLLLESTERIDEFITGTGSKLEST